MAEPDDELLSALADFLDRAQDGEKPSSSEKLDKSAIADDFRERLAAAEREANGLG